MSAKQAKQRQQRLANLLARRRLGLEKRALDIKAAKVGRVTNSELNKIITTFNDGTVKDEAKQQLAAQYPNDPRVQEQYRIAMGETLPDKPTLSPSTTNSQNDVVITNRKKELGNMRRGQLKTGKPPSGEPPARQSNSVNRRKRFNKRGRPKG